MAAIALGLPPPAQQGVEGQNFTLFTGTQASMRRTMDDAPARAEDSSEAIRLAQRLET